MTTSQPHTYFSYHNGQLSPVHSTVVREYPLQLIVNSREIATLIASPHDLRFLVAGFLRLQGFVTRLDEFEMLSVCEEFGTANVRIKGELPERLKPVLTSGCGTGISFSLPEALASAAPVPAAPLRPDMVLSLMDQLFQRADKYKSHGGIHSAATGRSGVLELYAEDLGRHNTIDRIAGEALLKGIDVRGAELATSGRVSTEMVAKASLLGIRLIASRTSPTDMAVQLCRQSGICLVGYVRGGKFTVYSHPEQLESYAANPKISGVCGAILAGGSSSRMGTNKAFLEIDGEPLISRTYRTLAGLFHEVVVVTNTPQDYDFLPCRKVPDLYPGIGSIAGLHAALAHSPAPRTFVVACDMPFVAPAIVRHLCALQQEGYDAVIPFSEGGQEPLHAVYSSACRDIFEKAIKNGERKILDILAGIRTRLVTWDEMQAVAGARVSFLNANTPEEFERVTKG